METEEMYGLVWYVQIKREKQHMPVIVRPLHCAIIERTTKGVSYAKADQHHRAEASRLCGCHPVKCFFGMCEYMFY